MFEKLKERLLNKYSSKTDINQHDQKINATAIETITQHRYDRRTKRVKALEHHNVLIKPVLQPIEEEVWEAPEVVEKVRPTEYVEVQHPMHAEHSQLQQEHNDILAGMGSHKILEDIEFEQDSEDEVLHERTYEHIVEEITPIIRRKVVKRHEIRETVPVFERHFHVHISPIVEFKPISMTEWRSRYQKKETERMI
jgi:hypothetical protein